MRRALLAGTALATTLLAASLAPTPAVAVDQTITFSDIISSTEIEILFNNSKLNSTLGADITNIGLTPFNSRVESNVNAVSVGNLNQLIDGEQVAISDNLIDILNFGEIDPAIGIFGQINNTGFNFFNSIVLDNINGNNVTISLGNLNQTIDLSHRHLTTNVITEDNRAKITADDFGMFAEINNTLITSFFNSAVLSNVSGTDSGVALGNHTQLIDFEQITVLSNTIDIDNTGAIDPDVGIFAGINNTLIASFFNSNILDNTTGSGTFATVGNLNQILELDHVNSIANSIALDNADPIVADDIGVYAEITNADITSFFNSTLLDNIHGDAAAIDLGNHTQSIDLYQINTIGNGILIENAAEIDSDTGILATITNENLTSISNSASGSNVNGELAVVSAGRLSQLGQFDQDNIIGSGIYLLNDGDVSGGNTGLEAWITNSNIGNLSNTATHVNIGGEAALIDFGDLVQRGEVEQLNAVVNEIAIANEDSVTARTGIQATIDNDGMSFQNNTTIGSTIAATTDIGDDLSQTFHVSQINVLANDISIANSGTVRGRSVGISAEILNQGLTFSNSATTNATSVGIIADDVNQDADVGQTNLIENKIAIVNTGKITGGSLGIYASIPDPDYTATNIANLNLDDPDASISLSQTNKVDSKIVIKNAGYISADNLFAIDTEGAKTTIRNRSGGVIKGYVDLTDKRDRFFNKEGGTFEARRQSDFRGGGDLFQNMGTVQTAEKPATERVSFVNLERFENAGLVSLVDGQVGDKFTISNTVGGTDLDYAASDGATLGVDVFLGGPGSKADNFIIQGDASGRTLLQVANTNSGGGAFNPQGIPVAFVDGDVKSNAFYLDKPIDAGFFDYDLFFVPTGSGFFELRSHPGAGSHVLPRLITASHDVFHTSTETWLDRTADLRVLLNGAAPIQPGAVTATGEPVPTTFVPAIWAKGQGTWLNQEDKGKSTSFGRTYRYDLERDLSVMNFETGIDMGQEDVLASGDMLVFGLLGGAVLASLDYNNVARHFDIEGGEVGAYATYLRGGLFVDSLLKAHFLDIETATRGFPGSIDSTTWGIRTDAGYRFGSFSRGPFVEPLATIAFSQNELDDFTIDGNYVDFDNETNVRGRLGLRVGTSSEAWEGTLFEPFLIASLWGNLSGEHNVSLTSSGRTFEFVDEPDDVWGVLSGGVNFFNPGAQTALFAKADVTVGEETDGISVKGGMRYNW